MLWGCVAAGATVNIVQVEGRMNFTKYPEIPDANVQRSVQTLKLKRGLVFQQINDDDESDDESKPQNQP